MGTTYQDLVVRSALVTGATSTGIRKTTTAMARRGARVLVSGRDVARNRAVVPQSGPTAKRLLKADLDDPESRETWRDAHSILPDTSISS